MVSAQSRHSLSISRVLLRIRILRALPLDDRAVRALVVLGGLRDGDAARVAVEVHSEGPAARGQGLEDGLVLLGDLLRIFLWC